MGQLSGGGSSCDAPKDPDWYGRMYSHFENVPTPLTSLDFWLDPNGDTETVDGIDPNPVVVIPSPTTPPPATPPPSSSGGGSTGSSGGGAFGLSSLLLMLAAARRRSA